MDTHEALITAQMHGKLLDLWHHLDVDGLMPSENPPQVGIMPKMHKLPRILLVGQAPGEVESSEDFSEAIKKSYRQLCWHMTEPSKSPFWIFNRQLISRLHADTQHDEIEDHPENVVGWTNLIKIGRRESIKVPKGRIFARQVEISTSIIRNELQKANADATLFLTGGEYPGPIQKPIFNDPASVWQDDPPDEPCPYMNHPDYGLVFWVDHPDPRVMSLDKRHKIFDRTIPLIIDRWRKRTGISANA